MGASLGQPEGDTDLSGTCLIKGQAYSPSHAGTVGSYYISTLLCCYPGTVRIIWAAHAGVHKAFQDNALAAVPENPYLNGSDESTLEIVVCFELLPLEHLLSCVHSRALDEITENVAELDGRPQSHGVLKVTRRVRVVCSS